VRLAPMADTADRIVSFYIDEFCRDLSMESGPAERSVGIFHRLTGRAYSLDAAGEMLLRLIRTESVEAQDVEALPIRAFLRRLEEEGFIASVRAPPERTACGVARSLTTFRLHRPLRNPAVAAIDAFGRAWIVRTSDVGTCRLPRTRWRPEIRRDALDGISVALLDLAAAGASWRHAEEALLSHGYSAEAIRRSLSFLTDTERQMIRLIAPEADEHDANAFFQFPCQNFTNTKREDGVTPAHLHYQTLNQVEENFDWLETTVSHAFRSPTAALGHRPFGARIAERYLEWAKTRASACQPLRILEIGGGLGYFAKAFVQRLAAVADPAPPASYTMLDRSPALRNHQKALLGDNPLFRFVLGDAQESLPGGSYDLIIANEVIADFEVAGMSNGGIRQTGAAKFIAAVGRHLAPGGKAYISEYGDRVALPKPVNHLEHAEHSVEFGPLLAIAASLGLEPSLTTLADLLRPDPSSSLLIGQHERYLCLGALLREGGADLQTRVYDQSEFEDSFAAMLRSMRILSPLFAAQAQELHFGPQISQFKVLELTAPVLVSAVQR
jgi:SAM-dependent methyltransferase